MTTAVIFNPTAGGERANAFRERLRADEGLVALFPTRSPGDARTLAREAVEAGYTTLAAAGGDGTVNEVLNGIGDARDGFRRARLAVLPLGTVNVFAKELRVPSDFDGAWKVLHSGNERTIDLPFADFESDQGRQRRFWVQLAGAGIDSRALALVNWELKKKAGPLAYVWAAFQALREPRPEITVETGSVTATGPIVVLGNGRFYGGRFPALPRADLTDGVIDLAIAPRITWPIVARGLWMLTRDQFADCRHAVHFQSKEFTLRSPRRIEFHLEGDNVGYLPATFGLVPLGLRVVVP